MDKKKFSVSCTYTDGGKELDEIILESFRLFLQKTLFELAIDPGV